MTYFKKIPARAVVVALNLSLLAAGALAADKTWSGATDNNWSTGNNWGGTQPVNADNLIFSGATRQNTTNDINNLTLGTLRFANGGFSLNGNPFTLNPTPAGLITNLVGTNIISNNLTITPAAKWWNVAAGTEVRLTGVITNTSASGTASGWLVLTNGGTARIMGTARSTRGMDLFQGAVIVDGGLVDANNDGFRFKPPTGQTISVHLTNNGTIRIGGGGNFRMGHNGTVIGPAGQAGGISQTFMSSGVLELYGANVSVLVGDQVAGATAIFNQNGGLVWGNGGSANNALVIGGVANADGTYNLNGGTLWVSQVRQGNAGATNVNFNFNGGTLKPMASSATFFQDLLNTTVKIGGAIIDTTNFNITIGQNLLAAGGGLTKLGTGVLTLSGASTYTGNTIVSNGSLVLSSGNLNGGGGLAIASGATLSITNPGGTLTHSTLTMGGAGSTVKFSFPSGNPGSAALFVTNLTGTSGATISVSGANFVAGSFPLIQFNTSSGLNNFQLGTLPPGVAATLVTNANSISLNISSVVKTLVWTGAANNQWNTSSINWADLNNGNSPTAYAQSGGFGDIVTFDGTGASQPAVNATLAVTPVAVTVDGSSAAFSFSGAGKISGVGSLTKSGGQPLTLGMVNDYSGGSTISDGPVRIAANEALGTGPATLNLNSTLMSDSATPRQLSNPFVLNSDTGVFFGDASNNGVLTLAGGFDLASGLNRTLTLNSDLVISGSLSNGAIVTKTGAGSLYVRGTALLANNPCSQQQGNVIVDGGTFNNANGYRLQGMLGNTVRLVVTNGGVMNISSGVNTGNLRVGLTGGDTASDNIVDLSGTINMSLTSGTVGANNAVSLGQASANAILYLRAGGLLITRALYGLDPGNAEAHFMGGTMRAIANDTGFIAGLTNAFMENGGLTIDTTNFSVTVPQALIAGGSGGLTKIGSGSLTLSGTNTYVGTTLVNAGKLVVTPSHIAPGGISVASNATLAFLSATPGAKASVPSATNTTGSSIEAQFTGLTNNPTAPAGFVTNLIINGTVGVNLVAANIKAGQFPLIGYNTLSGTGNLVVGQLPQGVVATVVTNTGAKTIDLVVSFVSPIFWTGAVSANWDTATTNWTVLGSPTIYSQGDNVQFSDGASNAFVSLATSLSPSGVLVSNSTLAYQFNGAGSLNGSTGLTKDGTNSLVVNTPNTFSGAVTVKAGTLIAGNATALGATNSAATVQSGATLDVGGQGLGLKPVVVGGGGVGGLGALVNLGADQNNALRDVTLTADTVFNCSGTFGIRMPDNADPGFRGNGFNLTKIGIGQLNLNGGQTTNGANYWDSDVATVDVKEGTISFQRRMAMGRTNYSVNVWPGANLLFFALNTVDMPIQVKPVSLTNATLSANGNNSSVAESTTFGGPVRVTGTSNFISTLTGVTLTLNGPISGAGTITYTGTNVLGATNTYTGSTVVTNGILQLASTGSIAASSGVNVLSNGVFDVTLVAPWTLGAGKTLGGSGSVNGNVIANGTLAPGSAVSTLTINGDLTINGNIAIEVDKSLAESNDVTVVSGALSNTGSGVVNVANLGGIALTNGDYFRIFSQPVANGAAMTITGAGATWTNNLAVDGSISVVSVTPSVPTTPITLSNVLSGGNLNLSWPADHIGWRLLVQTNSRAVGLVTPTSAWFTWPGSSTTNGASVSISPNNPTVFFRLVYP